jgi:hypothetical protein
MNHNGPLPEPERAGKSLSANDLFIKDAFLVFRALCKLTMKPLNTERSIPNYRLFYYIT